MTKKEGTKPATKVALTDIEFADLHAHLETTLRGKSMSADEAIFLIDIVRSADVRISNLPKGYKLVPVPIT